MQLEHSPSSPPPEETAASEFVARLRRERALVGGTVAAFLLLGTAYTVLVPPRWAADSTILMPGTRPTGAAAAAQSLGLSVGGGGDTSLTMFHKILDSERVLNMVARATGYPPKDVRKIRRVDEDTKGGSISIEVVDRDRRKAMRINQAMLDALRTIVTDLMLPSKDRKTALLDASLQNKQRQLTEAEDRLEAFSKTALTAPGALATVPTGSGSSATNMPTVSSSFRYSDQATSLGLQLKNLDARLSASQQKSQKAGSDEVLDYPPVEVWHKQIADIEGRLSAARATYAEDTPEVTALRREYDSVRALQQRDIDRYLGAVEQKVGGSTAPLDQERQGILSQVESIRKLAAAAPHEATEYQRLSRNVATLTSLVTQLRLQYEQSRLDSADDPNRWVVLDQPSIADEPVNKNYVRNVGLAGALGFLLSLPFVARRDARRRASSTAL